MGNSTQPVKSWRLNECRNTDNGESLDGLLSKCIDGDCDELDRKNVASKHIECDTTNCDIVSIRCRRHKKRFNVKREWTKTCGWLCPRCYEKLDAAVRSKYKPSDVSTIDIRPAEEGKQTIECRNIWKACTSQVADKEESKRDCSNRPSYKSPEQLNPTRQISELSKNISSLLPPWRMVCKKCRREMPVHKIWLETKSKVLCPECYSKMTQLEVRAFCIRHPEATAIVKKVCVASIDSNSPKTTHSETIIVPGDTSDESFGGWCSNSTIMRMSIKELTAAVRAGRVSKVRARIEFNRRKRASYFNDLPDVEPVSPILR